MRYLVLFIFALSSTVWAGNSVLVYNTSHNITEMSREPDTVRSIASITKLMTAMTTLDYNKDLSQRLKLSHRVSSHIPSQEYTRYELLMAMLIRSDNAAAETLAEDYPGGRAAFILAMNAKAQEWGMANTKFTDASGLDASNVSTARDVANLVQTASGYWLIREAATHQQVALDTKYKKKVRTISLPHTSGPLLFVFDRAIVSKTGLTSQAGWCVAMLAQQNKDEYVVVVLGAKSKQKRLDMVKDIRYNHFLDRDLFDLPLPTNNY